MPSFSLRRKSKSPGLPAKLERKTAELKERLSRLSFRRHSAPPLHGPRQETQDDQSPCRHNGASLHDDCEPVKLNVLPNHVLELVLDHLSLQDLVKAGLTHRSWRDVAMSDLLWRSRLGHSLPEPLLNTFKLSRRPWSQQVSTFYSTNLVSNAIFSSSGFSVATGIGRGPVASNGWRVQLSCWQVNKKGLRPKIIAELCESCGGANKLKVLSLTTPSWAMPEASQEIDLVAALRQQGVHPTDAAAFLDTCPEIEFSVWISCGDGQPDHWQNGFAVVVLDNGLDNGAAWSGSRTGSLIQRESSHAIWISWVIDPSLLKCSTSIKGSSGKFLNKARFKRLSCRLFDYKPGVRRAHVLLKGLDPRVIYNSSTDGAGGKIKPVVQFCAPVLRFKMPSA